ncbi:hypothetical protein BJX64DRAFT_286289 [Aspergillus heterothallicus]
MFSTSEVCTSTAPRLSPPYTGTSQAPRNGLELLVAEGAQADRRRDRGLREGTMAFRMALEGGTSEVAQFLLEAGADPNVQTKRGQTLLMRVILHIWQQISFTMLQEDGSCLHLKVAAREDRAGTSLA